MKKTILILSLLAAPFGQLIAADFDDEFAGFDNWEEEDQNAWTVMGFSEVYLGSFSKDNRLENRLGNNNSLREIRNEINTYRYFGNHFANLRLQFVGDALEDPTVDIDIRDLSVNFRLNKSMELKVGQQVLTWGTGDKLFINDMFPKDWRSLFAGRDDSYLKAPAAAAKFSVFSSAVNMDLVFVPVFSPDLFINGERFLFEDGTNSSQPVSLDPLYPEKNGKNPQWHLRLSKKINATELDIYAYDGFYTQPMGFDPALGRYIFPRLSTVGASLREDTRFGLLSAEISYWHSKDSRQLPVQYLPYHQFKSILGLEKELFKNFIATLQWQREEVVDYNELKNQVAANLPQKEHHNLALRLHWLTMSQKLTWSLFSYYSPNDEDGLHNFKVSYRHDDNWLFATGANYFYKQQKTTGWGRFHENSNYFAHVKYSF